jgi:pimeloyl-ACP methyl ester carboxylesterase
MIITRAAALHTVATDGAENAAMKREKGNSSYPESRPSAPAGAAHVIAPVARYLGESRRSSYGRKPALVLINGLAEQAETWYRNVRAWRRHFDVHAPNIVAYGGAALHRRIDEGLPIDIDYLVGRWQEYLDGFVQAPPYFLVASSMGGKVAVELALRRPDLVARLVLLCPSGLGDEERLPLVDGVRGTDARAMVHSVYYDPRRADPAVLRYYQECFADRRWRRGLLRTIRGTMEHSVRALLPRLEQPTLLLAGEADRIVDPDHAAAVAPLLPRGEFVCIPRCGHAPQVERAKVVNRLVVEFLTRPTPEPCGAA